MKGRAQVVAGSTVFLLTFGLGAPLCPYYSTSRDVVLIALASGVFGKVL